MNALRKATNETFRSLHVRNFRLFFSGQLISQVGNWLTLIAQTLLVLKLTDSGIALGALAVAQFGPVLVMGPWAGLIADRSDKRKLLLIVQMIAMVQSFALAALAFSGNPQVWQIYCIALVGGCTIAFDNPARRAFVVEMVPQDDMHNAVSLNSALMTSSRVIGPLFAGALIYTVGFGWCFLVDAISYTAVLAGLWMMRTEESRPSLPTVRAKRQVREGLRYVRSVPELWVPLVMMGVVGTLSYNFQTVFPLFAKRDLHGSGLTFTILFAVVSVGALIGALRTARRKTISVRIVALAALAYGGAMTLMAFAPNSWFAFPLGVVLGVASIEFLTASTSIVQIESAPEMRGRVLAIQAMLFLGSTPVGGPIVGWISEQFGARYAIGIGAVAALGAGAWGLSKARRVTAARVAAPDLAVTPDEDALATAEVLRNSA
ncbi:MAG TPA: MFS transporter [Acidimicrobiia bacterium]|nr:MFS transporter [Acidimicrobiia bacterium]